MLGFGFGGGTQAKALEYCSQKENSARYKFQK